VGTLRDWAAFFVDMSQRAIYRMQRCELAKLNRLGRPCETKIEERKNRK